MTNNNTAPTGQAHDANLETRILAIAYHMPEHRELAVESLSPDDFYTPASATVFAAIAKMHRDAGAAFDVLTFSSANKHEPCVAEFIARHDLALMPLDEYEGALSRLRQLSEVRYMTRCCLEVGAEGLDPLARTDPGEFLQRASQRLSAALEARRSKVGYQTFGEVMRPIMADMLAGKTYTPRLVCPTGIGTLDRAMVWGGFGSGELTVIMGRPGMGKTAMGLQCAKHNAVAGMHTAMFSFETSDQDLCMQILGSDARVPLRDLLGNVRPDVAALAQKHAGLLDEIPLYLFDCPGLKFEDFAIACRAMKRKNKLDLIVVDYLQKLFFRRHYQQRHEELSAVANGLKMLARELDVPVVALAQPNREGDKRADKRPTMADLGGSSAIEQDADRIIGLYRHCQHDANADEHEAEALMLKNRKARVGVIRLRFDGPTTTFSSADGWTS